MVMISFIPWLKLVGTHGPYELLPLHVLKFNPLNTELNPICHLLALQGGATIVDVSRLRVNTLLGCKGQDWFSSSGLLLPK
jgi:hypothetical protein